MEKERRGEERRYIFGLLHQCFASLLWSERRSNPPWTSPSTVVSHASLAILSSDLWGSGNELLANTIFGEDRERERD